MATAAELEVLSAQLREAYQLAWDAITAEQARIADDPARYTRRARLKELQRAVDERLDQVDEQARAWLANEFPQAYRAGAESAASSLADAFTWTTIDTDAVALLAQDTFAELLAASDGVSASTKSLIRTLGKEQALLKTAAGKTATQVGRDLRRLLEAKGIHAVRYADGSRHGIAEYADMLLRTKTAVAANAGGLAFARRAGTTYVEVFDGADCGWTSHGDPDLANGTIRTVEEASRNAISHPRCRRSFGPRPDVTTAEQARTAGPSTTEDQRADQAASEQARTSRRGSRPTRQPRKPRTPQPPPDPTFPGNLTAKDAEAWMRGRWSTTAAGEARSIFLDGLGNEAANAAGSVMDGLLRQYPRTAERIHIFGTSAKATEVANKIPGFRYKNIVGRAYADAAPKAGMIRVNGARARRFAETIADLEGDVAAGFHPPGTANMESVVAHEFGHHLRWQADAQVGRGTVDDEIRALLRRHAGVDDTATKGDVARARYDAMRSVSRYAATNTDELVGEAFAEVTVSAEPRQLSVDIVALIVRLAEG